MFLDIGLHPRFQNSTNTITSSNTNSTTDYFTLCNDVYEGIVFWACFTSVCVLFGVPACVGILWELLQRHRRGIPATPNDVFMLNLTVMDLVYLSFTPLGICNYMYLHNMPLEYVYNFLYAFNVAGRPLFMTCTCLDCYLAVVHPITYRARKSLTPRVLMSIGVWAFTLVYGALYARYNLDMLKTPGSIVPYAVIIVTIGICDFFILRALKSSGPGGRDPHPQKKKALQIIVTSLVMVVMTYLPTMLLTCLQTVMPVTEKVLLCRVFWPMFCSVTLGSIIMPVLYLCNLKKLDFIRRWCCCKGV